MANGEEVLLSIEEDIRLVQNRKNSDNVIMRRVRQPLRDVKPEHYDAEEFSFGLLNRFPLSSHGCKCQMANLYLEVLKELRNDRMVPEPEAIPHLQWRNLCDRVVPEPEAIRDLYELESDILSEDLLDVLTLDAVFLACFLGLKYYPSFQKHWPAFKSALNFKFKTMLDPLLRDLFKVENQIPLSLLHNVLKTLVQASGSRLEDKLEDKILSCICKNAVGAISHRLPGLALSAVETHHQKPIIKEDINFLECQNFLECLYHMIRSVEQQEEDDRVVNREAGADAAPSEQPRVEPKRRGKTDHVFVDHFEDYLPSLTKLREANIKCKGRGGKSLKVEFKINWHGLGATLYLPTLKVNDDTEAVWRNLVAYEECLYDPREGYSGHDFLHYLELMEKLIDTPDDVKLLRSGREPVILEDALGSNEAVARIFNNTVLKKCYRGERSKIWDSHHRQICTFYKHTPSPYFWRERYEPYFDYYWKVLPVFIGLASLSCATVSLFCAKVSLSVNYTSLLLNFKQFLRDGPPGH